MPYKDKEKALAYFRKRYSDAMEEVREYKLQQGCSDCGYNDHHAGLEFDHVEEKEACVPRFFGKGKDKLWAEIAKCEVVCGTCHNIRTFNRTQYSEYVE